MKKQKLPQSGGQYERDKKGAPVKVEPAKAATKPGTEQPTTEKE